MDRRGLSRIVERLRGSKTYARLERFMAFFEKTILTRPFFRKLRQTIVILKRRINRIIRKMRQNRVPDAKKMYFYRLVRRSLPAFSKAMSLKI